MGRMAAHTGQVITFDEMLNCDHEFAPDVDKLTIDGPAPLLVDARRQIPHPRTRHQDHAGILIPNRGTGFQPASAPFITCALRFPAQKRTARFSPK